MVRRALLLVLCGCQQVFGLDDPSAVAPDASGAFHGRMYLLEPRNNPDFTPALHEVAWRKLAGELIRADGSRQPLEIDSLGRFDFTPDALPYRLVFDADGTRREIESAAHTLDIGLRLSARYDAQAATPGTMLHVTIGGLPPSSSYRSVVSTGVWSGVSTSGGTITDFTVDWSPVGLLLDSDANDRAYALVTEMTSTGYARLSFGCDAGVKMIAGQTTSMSCTGKPLQLSKCSHIKGSPSLEATRIMNALSGESFQPAMSTWAIAGIPTNDAAVPAAPVLANGPALTSDFDLSVNYANPFPGHTPSVGMITYAARTFSGTSTNVTLPAFTRQIQPTAGDCATTETITPSVGFPAVISLDGHVLMQDGAPIELDRTKPARLSWTISPKAPGPVDHYAVWLYDLDAPVYPIVNWLTTNTQVSVDPSLLVTGRHYLFFVYAIAGVPYAADGNFTTTAYPTAPYAMAARPSATFVPN